MHPVANCRGGGSGPPVASAATVATVTPSDARTSGNAASPATRLTRLNTTQHGLRDKSCNVTLLYRATNTEEVVLCERRGSYD